MKYRIRCRFTGKVLYSADADSIRECVEKAIKEGANLQDAYLQGANLQYANLQYADLHGAFLWGANLRGADLGGADLQGAFLRDANLRDANLRGADLGGADLGGAEGILRFNGERHEAIAHMHEGEVYIKIGCEHHTAQDWVKSFKTIGKREGYSKSEIDSYGAFIGLVVKHFKGRK